MQTIIHFLKSTAIPMQEPKAYGAFHLLFWIIGTALAILAAYWLRNTTDRQNRRVLLVVGFFLLIAEIYKQAFQYYAIGYTTYPFGIFPFHICSTPMYLSMIAGVLKPGRLQDALQNYIGTFGFAAGFIAFVEPSGLTQAYWPQTLHSFVWHILLVFLGVYLSFSGRVGRKRGDFKPAFFVYLSLCAVALVLDFAFYNVSNGTMNMFFIGPAGSSLIVFSDISKLLGWYVNTPLFIGCMTLGAFLVYWPNRRFHEKQDLGINQQRRLLHNKA